MSFRSTTLAYLALAKPTKVYRLLAGAGLALLVALPIAAGRWPAVLVTMVGGLIAAAGANVLNMYIERETDRKSGRYDRPLVSGRARPKAALCLGVGLVVLAAAIVAMLANRAVAVITLAAVATYVGAYTCWLKPRSPCYTLVGGTIWAAPIVIVWTAAGKPMTATPLLVFVLTACWTALHAWSVGLIDEGRSAGAQFMPLVWGRKKTRLCLLATSAAIVAATLALGQQVMLPFDAALLAVAAASCFAASAWADRLLARASIFYICAYVAAVALGSPSGAQAGAAIMAP